MNSSVTQMQNNLDKTVPRYTSYPTAPHFSSAVDANVYRDWLESLASDASLSLYLHVPYCRTLCHYCGCHTKATLRRDPIDAYARTLTEEIAIVAAHAGKRRITHLHWGGGTPSILGEDALKYIVDELDRRFDFATGCEHAIELDPRYVTRPLTQALRDIGVTRASLGVQDFSLSTCSARPAASSRSIWSRMRSPCCAASASTRSTST